MVYCKACNLNVSKISAHKRTNIHKSNCLIQTSYENVQILASAFKNRIVSYRINATEGIISPEVFLQEITDTTMSLISNCLKVHKSVKIGIELFISFILLKNEQTSLKSFNTSYNIVYQSTDILKLLQMCYGRMISKCSEFESSESGWSVEFVSHLEVNIVKYNPLRAGSHIPLPPRIRNTKSCINICNDDEFCFAWCIVAHIYPVQRNKNRVSSYPHYSTILNVDGIIFPPSVDDIRKFEKNNPTISVNVYGLEKHDTIAGPLYKTAKRKLFHVNLLYISRNGKNHFCLISNFERLVHKQLTKNRKKMFLCDECFSYFDSEDKLNNHDCARVKTILPEENSKLGFSNYERTQRIPIVIYGDFESLLQEYSDKSKSAYTENI